MKGALRTEGKITSSRVYSPCLLYAGSQLTSIFPGSLVLQVTSRRGSGTEVKWAFENIMNEMHDPLPNIPLVFAILWKTFLDSSKLKAFADNKIYVI